jgi:hypothetical protein
MVLSKQEFAVCKTRASVDHVRRQMQDLQYAKRGLFQHLRGSLLEQQQAQNALLICCQSQAVEVDLILTARGSKAQLFLPTLAHQLVAVEIKTRVDKLVQETLALQVHPSARLLPSIATRLHGRLETVVPKRLLVLPDSVVGLSECRETI